MTLDTRLDPSLDDIVVARGDRHRVVNPSTLELVAELPGSTSDDVDAAVREAAGAQRSWARTEFAERGAILARAAELIRGAADEIARLLTREQGKPLKEAALEVGRCADSFEIYSRVDPLEAEERELEGRRAYVVRRPVGVCAAIVPWNFPLTLMANKVAPALAAGNTLVVKPSPSTSLAAARCIALLHEAGLPSEVVRMVIGDADVGSALVTHPLVRKVSFTGSVPTGRAIMQLAAPGLKRLTLELGGNDPMIVCADADVESAARAAAIGRFFNAGQACIATKRIYVDRAVVDEFVDQVRARATRLEVGDGFEPGVRMGPLHGAPQRELVEGFVDDAVGRGAKVAAGGRRPQQIGPGHFYEPTVLLDVPDEARLVGEECFGPVLPIFVFDSVDEALRRADATDFGLGSSLWTNDAELAQRVLEELEAGYLWVNEIAIDHDEMPFGGVKASGFGKERGREVLAEYTEAKSLVLG